MNSAQEHLLVWSIAVLVFLSAGSPLSAEKAANDLPEGAVQRLGTLRLTYQGDVADYCYLPDGRTAVAVGHYVDVWDMSTAERLERHEVASQTLRSIECRDDGRVLLLAQSNGDVLEWNLETREKIRGWTTGQKDLGSAVYSPDGKRALTVAKLPPTLKQWDVETGKELIAIKGGMAYFQQAVYGPDGATAWIGGGHAHVLEEYDLESGERLRALLRDYCVYDMARSPDGERLLVGSRHRALEWRMADAEKLGEFSGHHGYAVPSVAYCGEPDQILTGSRDGSIRRWNRHNSKVLDRWIAHEGHVNSMKISPDGRWVLSYSGGRLVEYDVNTGEPRLDVSRHMGAVQDAAFSPGDKRVVSASVDGTLAIWDIQTGGITKTIQVGELGVCCVAVSPDGGRVAAGSTDGVIREFDTATGELVRKLEGHRGMVRSLAYLPQERQMSSHDYSDAGERQIDPYHVDPAANDQETPVVIAENPAKIHPQAVDSSCRLVSSADDGAVLLWAQDGTEPVARLEGHRGGVLTLDVSGNGRYLITGGRDCTVRLWDLPARKSIRTIDPAHLGWVEAVAFADGPGDAGPVAVSAGRDGRVIKWHLLDGEELDSVSHGSWVKALAVDRGQSRVYSAGDDGDIAVRDLDGGDLIRRFAGHNETVNGLGLSANGDLLVSASSDTTLVVWSCGR